MTAWLPEKQSLLKSITKQFKIANIATCANLVSGLLAIYLSIHGQYVTASLAIIVGAWLDVLDGKLAKLLGQSSDFGAELDSLADLISFGVAPAVLLVTYYPEHWLAVVALFLPVCGALRLARHNINRQNLKGTFIGVPIDASAVVVPPLIWFSANQVIAAILVITLSALYVSPLKIPKIFR